jgi:hypothetical protein
MLADELDKWQKLRKDVKPVVTELPDPKKPIDAGVKKGPEPTSMGACSVANAAVAKALRDMGYNFKTEDFAGGVGCQHILTVEQDGKPVTVQVSHLFGKTIWVGIPVARIDEKKAASPTLLRLLEENYNTFPSMFMYDKSSRKLFLSRPVDQQDMLTPERFRSELNGLLDTAKRKQALLTDLDKP